MLSGPCQQVEQRLYVVMSRNDRVLDVSRNESPRILKSDSARMVSSSLETEPVVSGVVNHCTLRR